MINQNVLAERRFSDIKPGTMFQISGQLCVKLSSEFVDEQHNSCVVENGALVNIRQDEICTVVKDVDVVKSECTDNVLPHSAAVSAISDLLKVFDDEADKLYSISCSCNRSDITRSDCSSCKSVYGNRCYCPMSDADTYYESRKELLGSIYALGHVIQFFDKVGPNAVTTHVYKEK